MIDALLFSVRDAILAMKKPGWDYSYHTCEVMDDGKPKPNMGQIFLSVHQGTETSGADNSLDELFSVSLTLTMAVNIALDQIGNGLLARQTAKQNGFNMRCRRLCTWMHMNWSLLSLANAWLMANAGDEEFVYGFCEPLRYKRKDQPNFVGADWMGLQQGAVNIALSARMDFADARRLSAMGSYN